MDLSEQVALHERRVVHLIRGLGHVDERNGGNGEGGRQNRRFRLVVGGDDVLHVRKGVGRVLLGVKERGGHDEKTKLFADLHQLLPNGLIFLHLHVLFLLELQNLSICPL